MNLSEQEKIESEISQDLYSLLHKYYEKYESIQSFELYDIFKYSLQDLERKSLIKILLTGNDKV